MPDSGKVTVVVRGRMSKMISMGSRLAIGIAREKDPELFARYKHLRASYLKFKKLLIRKYQHIGMQRARDILSKNDD